MLERAKGKREVVREREIGEERETGRKREEKRGSERYGGMGGGGRRERERERVVGLLVDGRFLHKAEFWLKRLVWGCQGSGAGPGQVI